MGFFLETAVHDPSAQWIVGGSILLVLLIALQIVRGIGKSRPHS